MATSIEPGAGYGGATSGATVGAGGATAIARWITPQRQEVTAAFKVGVLLFHLNGEDKVAFSVNGGTPADATAMTKETDGLGEETAYWAEIDPADFSDDDEIEIRAVCYPASDGEARVLQDADGQDDGDKSLFLWANDGGTADMFDVEVYVDSVSGNDTTGDGTTGTPYATFAGALQKVADANSGKFAGCTILAKAGTYAFKTAATATDTTKKWVTFRPAAGVAKADVIITERASDADTTNGIWLKVDGCTIVQEIGNNAIFYATDGVARLWLEDCHKDGEGAETNDSSFLIRTGSSFGGICYTNTLDSGTSDGFSTGQYPYLNRNCTRDATCTGDSFSGNACAVAWTDSAYQVDPQHADSQQFYTTGTYTNVISYRGKSINTGHDGLAMSGAASIDGMAIVNCLWEGTTNNVVIGVDVEHLVIRNNTFENLRAHLFSGTSAHNVIEHNWIGFCYLGSGASEVGLEADATWRKNHFANTSSYGWVTPGSDVTTGSSIAAIFPNYASDDYIPYDTVQAYTRVAEFDAGKNARDTTSAVGAYASKEEYTSTPPWAPTNVQVAALGTTSLRVTWSDTNGNETGYEVKYATSSGGALTLAGTTAADATTYDITGLSSGTTYYIKVNATNGSGDGPLSSEVSKATLSFPGGWQRKCEIAIDYTKVGTGGLSNFSVLLTEANLPSEIFDEANADGSDIRFSSDSAGSTQIPFDLIRFDTSGDTAIIRVKVPSLSDSVNTSIYVWYGNSAATALATNDTYGQYNAYDSNWIGYWPLEESPDGGSGCILNRISNALHGTPAGATSSGDLVAAKVGNGIDLDGSADLVDVANAAAIQTLTNFTYSIWLKQPSWTTNKTAFSKHDSRLYTNQPTGGHEAIAFFVDYATTDADARSSDLGSTLTTNWTHVVGAIASSDQVPHLYVNGAEVSYERQVTGSGSRTSDSGSPLKIGDNRFNSGGWLGQLDEAQIHNTTRSAAWVLTEYNTTNNPGTFAAEGTPSDVAPLAPSNIVPTVDSSTQITVSWTDNSSNETGFEIDYGTASNFAGATTTTASADATSKIITGLTAGTLYYFRVRSTNAAGDSANSDTVSATTTAFAAGSISLDSAGATTLTLSATDATGGTAPYTYQWFLGNSPLAEGAGTQIGDDDLTLAATGLTESTFYYFRLRYTDANANVVYSEQFVEATTEAALGGSVVDSTAQEAVLLIE